MRRSLAHILLGALGLIGCQQDMAEQPRYEPLEASTFFEDGRGSRPLVPGTVAQGQLHEDEHLYTGVVGGKPAEQFPFAITKDIMQRGRQRFDIFCSPCHGRVGDGRGMIVSRGFPAPPSFHIDRLRTAPAGHFFGVITKGYGRMFDYSDRIAAADRWAIVAYIRALQLSQNAKLPDVPEADRAKLEGSAP
jgi:mono/diheme cytochrome c family protein